MTLVPLSLSELEMLIMGLSHQDKSGAGQDVLKRSVLSSPASRLNK